MKTLLFWTQLLKPNQILKLQSPFTTFHILDDEKDTEFFWEKTKFWRGGKNILFEQKKLFFLNNLKVANLETGNFECKWNLNAVIKVWMGLSFNLYQSKIEVKFMQNKKCHFVNTNHFYFILNCLSIRKKEIKKNYFKTL